MASILVLALTRAELLDRLKAPPVTQLDGLVQVYGDCPADMRREYQLPIASYVSDICRRLYAADNMRPQKFTDPGIVVRIGDVRTNIAGVHYDRIFKIFFVESLFVHFNNLLIYIQNVLYAPCLTILTILLPTHLCCCF